MFGFVFLCDRFFFFEGTLKSRSPGRGGTFQQVNQDDKHCVRRRQMISCVGCVDTIPRVVIEKKNVL